MTDFVTRVIPTKISMFAKLACSPMAAKRPVTIFPKIEFAPPSPALNCAATGTRAPMLIISEMLANNMHMETDNGLAPGAFQNMERILFIPVRLGKHWVRATRQG